VENLGYTYEESPKGFIVMRSSYHFLSWETSPVYYVFLVCMRFYA